MPGYLLSKIQQFLSLMMLIPQKESKLYRGNYGGKEKKSTAVINQKRSI